MTAPSFLPCIYERDRHAGRLEPEMEQAIMAGVQKIIDALGAQQAQKVNQADGKNKESNNPSTFELWCLPARDLADELTARMLAQVLNQQGIPAAHVPAKSLAGGIIERIAKSKYPVVCIAALPPKALAHTRYLCKRLKQEFSEARLAVGLWGKFTYAIRMMPRVAEVGADAVLPSLAACAQWARLKNERISYRLR